MSKKVVFIHGSPRKNGNTRYITDIAVREFRDLNFEVDEIDTIALNAKVPGCIDCCKCHDSKDYGCAIGDEVSEKVNTLKDYDIIIISTPIYWWSYTAQLKIFIDRFYSLGKDKDGKYLTVLDGKTFGLIATGGGGIDNNLELLKKQLEEPVKELFNGKYEYCLYPYVDHREGSILEKPLNIRQVKDFVNRLIS